LCSCSGCCSSEVWHVCRVVSVPVPPRCESRWVSARCSVNIHHSIRSRRGVLPHRQPVHVSGSDRVPCVVARVARACVACAFR
jgi:hypothetical protein